MKKKFFYIWMMTFICVVTACNNDEYNTNDLKENSRVTIGTNINHDLYTRATPPTLPGYIMRFALEVWQQDQIIYREEKLQESQDMVFSFNLENPGEYNVLVWADYIKESPETTEETEPNTYTHYTDLYYQTNTSNGLKEITITRENYIINDASRDAFCVCQTITKSALECKQTLTLNRPFGQLNLIEKDNALLEKVKKMNCSYKVPETFNVETSTLGHTTLDIQAFVETLPTSGDNHKANILYDYIFAPTGNSNYLSPITLEFESNDPSFYLNTFTLPENTIPMLRNKRTNAKGSIIKQTSAASGKTDITITIDSEWQPDQEYPLTPSNNEGSLSDFNNQNNPFSK